MAGGNPDLIAKLDTTATPDRGGLLTSAAQSTAANDLLSFGFVVSCTFGREGFVESALGAQSPRI